MQLSRDREALREQSPPHARRRAEAHRVAQPGVEAGDRRGQRRVRRRRPALRGRRRHRHRRRRPRRSSIPHVSIGQVTAYEAIGLVRKSPMEPIMRMALHRAPRAHHRRSGPTSSGILSEVVDPPERLRDAAQELAEKIARNSPAAMAATKRALWGALELGLTDACRAGAAELVGDVGPPRPGPRARWPSPRSASPTGLPLDARRRPRTMTYSSYEFLKVERHGPVGWLINNRPDQLNAMNSGMRDEFAIAWKELDADPDGAGDRAHRRGPGVPDRRRRRRDRQRRRRHGALPRVGGELGPPLHGVAPAGVEAGHHRGQRHLRRRRRSTGSPTPTS